MPRTEGQLHIDPTDLMGQSSVLVLGVDDENLDALAQRAQRKRREKVGVDGARVPERPDVRVEVAPMLERVDQHGRPGRAVRPDHEAASVLKIWFQPRKERGERGGVQYALASETVDAEWKRGEKSLEHPQGARLKRAEHRARCGLDTKRSGLKLFAAPRSESQVHRNVKRFVLALRQAALQVLGIWQRAAHQRIRSSVCVLVDKARRAHVDQLSLQIVDDPRDRQRRCMPGEAQVLLMCEEPKYPPILQLDSTQALHIPGAAHSTGTRLTVTTLPARGCPV